MKASDKHPTVSIVVPTYNAAKYISITLESVADQTFTDWELLIVDDCSSDETCALVQKWVQKDERIRLEILSTNSGGPAKPRNVGVRLAKAKYIALLDSDDIWHPRKLEAQIVAMRRQKNEFCCTANRYFRNIADVDFQEIGDTGDLHCFFTTFRQNSMKARIPTSSVILSKDYLLEFPFCEAARYKAVDDYHCWLRVLEKHGDCLKIDAPLLYYRRSQGQLSESIWFKIKKVFLVHREYPGRTFFMTCLLTSCYLFGAAHSVFVKRGT